MGLDLWLDLRLGLHSMALIAIGRVGAQLVIHFQGTMDLILPASVCHVSAGKSVFASEAIGSGHDTWQGRRLCHSRSFTGLMS